MEKPLRILGVVNGPWDLRLGASRVWFELLEQWKAAGHTVEHYSLDEAFANARASRATFALRQVFFAYRAAAFIRQNANRFDVIDALLGTVPFSKRSLHFRGLLVARSVGLYRLYDKFDRTARERRPRQSKGKIVGRILYGYTKRRSFLASELALRHADLVNLPNEDELRCVREEIRSDKPAIVQPYGLTSERRRTLREAADAPAVRLATQRISFIGMWSARKGSGDWPELIRRIRDRVPVARFRFLGTMVEPASVFRDLPDGAPAYVEVVPDYLPDDLPILLKDCAVAGFPSYVEGFGLAVLEQIAAGIPTVAYDIPGPRDLLHGHLCELLVPVGNVPALADAICRALELDLPAYEKLSDQSAKAATQFSWSKIADDTARAYRSALATVAPESIVFVQPFSLGSTGGGARILRALVEHAPTPWRSICSAPVTPKPWQNETHLPSRPSWGPIEHSRLALLPKLSSPIFAPRFFARLTELCRELGARAIHAIAHSGLDFVYAQRAARRLRIPFFLSVHDDLLYTAGNALSASAVNTAMADAWQNADARFVISEPLGREYCRRYGDREYGIVTDGVTTVGEIRPSADPRKLRIYFMGMFHMPYEANLHALLQGASLYQKMHPEVSVDVTCRCEHIRPQVLSGSVSVTVLAFASEAEVHRDIENADLLYMPLPFGDEHANFTRYSLSTKMVTYVGSGVPVLYHGPTNSAAFELLKQNDAAVFVTTLNPEDVANTLGQLDDSTRRTVSANALRLAKRQFMLADQTRTFWETVGRFVSLR